MNQVEFIKKWAKHGDRIEDDKCKYQIILWHETTIFVCNLRSGMQEKIQMIRWQSPKIYMLKNFYQSAVSSCYTEEWELIADYADVVKKEQENNGENTLYGIIAKELSSGKPLGNVIYTFASEAEKRLKALEDKIK